VGTRRAYKDADMFKIKYVRRRLALPSTKCRLPGKHPLVREMPHVFYSKVAFFLSTPGGVKHE